MEYLITQYERFGKLNKVKLLKGEFEVIGDKDIIEFAHRRRPHLINYDGERAYTKLPEALAEYMYNIKGSYKKYRLIFIPINWT